PSARCRTRRGARACPCRPTDRSCRGAPWPCTRPACSWRTRRGSCLLPEYPRIEAAIRVEGRLRRAPGGRERLRALLVVPAAVVAADGVMVRDRAARGEHRGAGDGLDRAPPGDLLAP